MLAVSLKDTSGVKYAEDFIKLSVAQSEHIFPTKVKKKKYNIMYTDTQRMSLIVSSGIYF